MPTDYEHKGSRETQDQRKRFASAARRWASLPPPIKAELTRKYGIVWRHHSPGLSQKDVLEGMQLFISQEIHAQEYHQKHTATPLWVCLHLTFPWGGTAPFNPQARAYSDWTSQVIPSLLLSPGNIFYCPIPTYRENATLVSEDWYFFTHDYHPYYTLEEFLKLTEETCYPYLYCSTWSPELNITRSPNPNFKYFPTSYPQWWLFDIHEQHGPNPNDYYPDPMCTISVEDIGNYQLRVHITPYTVRHNNLIYSHPLGTPRLEWWLRTAPGGYTLEPNKTTAIIKRPYGSVIRYED